MLIGASSPRVSLARNVAAYPVLLPPTLGEHVEQNVSLATSSDARLRRPVRATVLRRADVCAMERVRHHGSTPPRKQCTPGASWGSGGIIVPPGQFRAGFSEQQQFIIIASCIKSVSWIHGKTSKTDRR